MCTLHLVPTVSPLRLLQSGILSHQPSECVPLLTHSTITSRPTISSMTSNHVEPPSCTEDLASADHCVHLQLYLLSYLLYYLLTYNLQCCCFTFAVVFLASNIVFFNVTYVAKQTLSSSHSL